MSVMGETNGMSMTLGDMGANSTPVERLGNLGNPEFGGANNQAQSTDYSALLKSTQAMMQGNPGQMPGQMPSQPSMGHDFGQLAQLAQYESPRRRAPRPARPPARVAPVSRINIKFLRPALVVAAIVFVVLRNIAPQIAKSVPAAVDAATGKFTIPGLLVIALLSGGMFLGVTEMVNRLKF